MFDYEKLMPSARSKGGVSLSLLFSLSLAVSFLVNFSASLSSSVPPLCLLPSLSPAVPVCKNSLNGVFAWPQLSFDCPSGQGVFGAGRAEERGEQRQGGAEN